MKHSILIFTIFCLFTSCSSNVKNGKANNSQPVNYIKVIENEGFYNVAYTDDGHLIMYQKDSIGSYTAYFTKFLENSGKYGLKDIEERIIRIDMDSSLSYINCIISLYSSAICTPTDTDTYCVDIFDNNFRRINTKEIRMELAQDYKNSNEEFDEEKKIILLLNDAYYIVNEINESNIRGLYNILLSLESVTKLLSYEVMKQDRIYLPKISKRVERFGNITKEMSYLKNELYTEYEQIIDSL